MAVFGDFKAAVDEEEIHCCLFDDGTGIFDMYPEVSGLLYFEEKFGQYFFSYMQNPSAEIRFDLLSGAFPPDTISV